MTKDRWPVASILLSAVAAVLYWLAPFVLDYLVVFVVLALLTCVHIVATVTAIILAFTSSLHSVDLRRMGAGPKELVGVIAASVVFGVVAVLSMDPVLSTALIWTAGISGVLLAAFIVFKMRRKKPRLGTT